MALFIDICQNSVRSPVHKGNKLELLFFLSKSVREHSTFAHHQLKKSKLDLA